MSSIFFQRTCTIKTLSDELDVKISNNCEVYPLVSLESSTRRGYKGRHSKVSKGENLKKLKGEKKKKENQSPDVTHKGDENEKKSSSKNNNDGAENFYRNRQERARSDGKRNGNSSGQKRYGKFEQKEIIFGGSLSSDSSDSVLRIKLPETKPKVRRSAENRKNSSSEQKRFGKFERKGIIFGPSLSSVSSDSVIKRTVPETAPKVRTGPPSKKDPKLRNRKYSSIVYENNTNEKMEYVDKIRKWMDFRRSKMVEQPRLHDDNRVRRERTSPSVEIQAKDDSPTGSYGDGGAVALSGWVGDDPHMPANESRDAPASTRMCLDADRSGVDDATTPVDPGRMATNERKGVAGADREYGIIETEAAAEYSTEIVLSDLEIQNTVSADRSKKDPVRETVPPPPGRRKLIDMDAISKELEETMESITYDMRRMTSVVVDKTWLDSWLADNEDTEFEENRQKNLMFLDNELDNLLEESV